jgi:spermidine dehydrogenase
MAKKLKNISRRDFLNGTSILIAAGVSPAILSACVDAGTSPHGTASDTVYPPRLTGMRGSHVGSFEVAHDFASGARSWPRPQQQTDTDYDLIIVGGGISGLSTAHFYRQRFGSESRILIIENHDDFGGHAKRNEILADGETLISYGGSQGLEEPSQFPEITKQLLEDLGIEPDRFHRYFDQSFFSGHDLGEGVFFDHEHYGIDKLTKSLSPIFAESPDQDTLRETIATFPLSAMAREALESLYLHPRDYLSDLEPDAKRDLMRRISYEEYIRDHVGMPSEVVTYLRRKFVGIWGIGWDALSGMEGVRLGMPGTFELGLAEGATGPVDEEEPFVFIFPDGNASVARLLVRKLVPDAIAGDTMEDIVLAQVDYSRLDIEESPVKIRLSATAIEARNTDDGTAVEVIYVQDESAHRVRGAHAVMAGYNHMLPFICPDLPQSQRDALEYAEKTPLVYANIALRNWHAFKNAGVFRFYSPQAMFHATMLGYPVSMGGHEYPSSPDEPVMVVMQYVPITPGEGLGMKEQCRLGRQRLYQMTFDHFEEKIVDQLAGALGPYGFDAERDIAGITVNRWPHGYAYEYNELEDDWSYGADHGPHIAGRAPIGRITIANSDSQASAYVQGAVMAASRAVNELPRS